MDLPFLNTSPSPEGTDGADDATLNDLLALYQTANDVPPPLAPLAEADPFAAPEPFAMTPAVVSPDAEIDDLIKSFQDAAPAAFEPPPFAAPEPFAAPTAPEPPFMAAPEPPFMAGSEPAVPEPPFMAAPEPVASEPPFMAAPAAPMDSPFGADLAALDPFAAELAALEAMPEPAAADPFAVPDLPAPFEEPAMMATPEPMAMEPVDPEPVIAAPEPMAPEPVALEPLAPVIEEVQAIVPAATAVPFEDVAMETAAAEPAAAEPASVVPAPVVPATPAPVAPVPAMPSVAMEPFTGELPSITTSAERQAVNRSVLESLSAIATGIDHVQGELNGLYENLAQAAAHRASVGEIVNLTERLTAVKGEVGENSALYQQALQLRAVAEAYMQLLKNL